MVAFDRSELTSSKSVQVKGRAENYDPGDLLVIDPAGERTEVVALLRAENYEVPKLYFDADFAGCNVQSFDPGASSNYKCDRHS